MTVHDLVENAVTRLDEAGISDAAIEAAMLLGHLLDFSRAQLVLAAYDELGKETVRDFEEALLRRLGREPLAYIIGEQEFWSLPFTVTPDVLIPRPETELLIETTLQEMKKEGTGLSGPVLDLGTGSGAIPIVLALELPDVMVYSLDQSFSALNVASGNARFHNVQDRVRFICSDWLQGISCKRIFSVVVTNPPYIAGSELAHLQPEVRGYEPVSALDGGERGMEMIERIARQVPQALKRGGLFVMEIGADQEQYVLDLFGSIPELESLGVRKDYAGHPRIFLARRK